MADGFILANGTAVLADRLLEKATIVARGDDYLYATFTTPIMGFVDDAEFTVDAARGTIDLRSASRLGHSDLGVNRKRIETLRAAFAETGA